VITAYQHAAPTVDARPLTSGPAGYFLTCINLRLTGRLKAFAHRLRRLFVPTKKKTAHRSPWSKEGVKELKSHSKARTPVAKIAKAMKRTEGAPRRKAGIIGIGLGHDR
jgi:hypothetical protein